MPDHQTGAGTKWLPEISVITVCYNSEKHIEQTITSIAAQTYKNLEYIIIDGGSTDGTIDIIRKHDAHIHKWISEPDNGIAHAMNKGLELARGDYILFLHSDDYLLSPDVLKEASRFLHPPFDIVMFDIIFEDNGRKIYRAPRGFNWWINFKTGVFHQSVFCSKRLFEQVGAFDTRYRVAMDYDFFLRAYRAGVSHCRVRCPLAAMRLTGISSKKDWRNLRERLEEEKKVHYSHCNRAYLKILYGFYWLLYLPYRRMLAGMESTLVI